MKKSPIRIVGYTSRVDLRKCTARKNYLDKLAKHFKMKNGEAICFTNKAQNRFRLVMKMNDMMFMCVPEIDNQDNKLSIYLRVSEELSRLAGLREPRIELELLANSTRERITRRAALRRRRKTTRRG